MLAQSQPLKFSCSKSCFWRVGRTYFEVRFVRKYSSFEWMCYGSHSYQFDAPLRETTTRQHTPLSLCECTMWQDTAELWKNLGTNFKKIARWMHQGIAMNALLSSGRILRVCFAARDPELRRCLLSSTWIIRRAPPSNEVDKEQSRNGRTGTKETNSRTTTGGAFWISGIQKCTLLRESDAKCGFSCNDWGHTMCFTV